MKIKIIFTALFKLIIIPFVVTAITLSSLSAQTAQTNPAGPGINGMNGSGQVDDFGGTPQVPFDPNMCLMLMVVGIAFGVKQQKKKVTYSEAQS